MCDDFPSPLGATNSSPSGSTSDPRQYAVLAIHLNLTHSAYGPYPSEEAADNVCALLERTGDTLISRPTWLMPQEEDPVATLRSVSSDGVVVMTGFIAEVMRARGEEQDDLPSTAESTPAAAWIMSAGDPSVGLLVGPFPSPGHVSEWIDAASLSRLPRDLGSLQILRLRATPVLGHGDPADERPHPASDDRDGGPSRLEQVPDSGPAFSPASPDDLVGRNHRDLVRCMKSAPAETITAIGDRLPLTPMPSSQVLYEALLAAREARRDSSIPLSIDEAALLVGAIMVPRVCCSCALWTDDAAWRLWLDLAPLAPPGWVAPIACLIALMAHDHGHVDMARVAIARAQADWPDHPLVSVVEAMLAGRIPVTTLVTVLHHALTVFPLEGSADDTAPRPPTC